MSWIRPVGEETAKMVEYISNFISSRIKRKIILYSMLRLLNFVLSQAKFDFL